MSLITFAIGVVVGFAIGNLAEKGTFTRWFSKLKDQLTKH